MSTENSTKVEAIRRYLDVTRAATNDGDAISYLLDEARAMLRTLIFTEDALEGDTATVVHVALCNLDALHALLEEPGMIREPRRDQQPAA